MSKFIKNSATITYNDNQTDKTCPVQTIVYEDGASIHKIAFTADSGLIEEEDKDGNIKGTVGKDGLITYRLEVYNPLPVPMHNVKIKDVLTNLPAGSTVVDSNPAGITISDDGTTITIPDIALIESEGVERIMYQIQLPEDAALGTVISNTATLTHYRENPDYDPDDPDSGEQFEEQDEINSETIIITNERMDIDSTKVGPESVVLNEKFEYTIDFNNSGNLEAPVNSIVDDMPDGFELDPPLGDSNPTVEIIIPAELNPDGTVKTPESVESTLVYGTNYTATVTGNELEILPVGEGTLNIPANRTLRVTINGKMKETTTTTP